MHRQRRARPRGPAAPQRAKSAPAVAAAAVSQMLRSAVALHQQGKLSEAEKLYEEVLQRAPNNFDARHLLGVVAVQTGRTERGVELFDQAIAAKPNAAAPHSNRGNALHMLGRLEEALASVDQAIALQASFADAWGNRGNILRSLGRNQAALTSYDKAVALNPSYAEAYNNRGPILRELGRTEEALESFDKAISIRPDYADAYSNRGNALRVLKRFDESLASLDKAVELNPKYVEAYNNRGVTLAEMGRLDDAVASYDAALDLNPQYAEAHNNRANALRELGRLYEVMSGYDRALAYKPDYPQAKLNKGLLLLTFGRFEEGLPLYEERFAGDYVKPRRFDQPQWSGAEDLTGKTVFLYGEQGLGDVIQFCRYVRMVQERRARVVLSAPDRLHRLLRRLDPPVQLVRDSEQPVAFDFHSSLMSLPLAFGTRVDTIPAASKYLSAEPALIRKWKARIGERGFKIGICWQGTPSRIDFGRSLPLASFERLAAVPGVRLISLQKGPGEAQIDEARKRFNVETLGDEFDAGPDAFVDTAATIACCDLVITSDTSVAHLAGALGAPTWIALKQLADWRWLLHRTDSPWYPSLRLFRQRKPDDWAGVFAEMEAALRPLVKPAPAPEPRRFDTPVVPVSWGEAIDKLTILEIKARKLEAPAALANVRNELEVLRAATSEALEGVEGLAPLKDRLAEVNERLWVIEDDIRLKEAAAKFDEGFIELARAVYRRNDERARIKREINALLGSQLVEEKSYATAGGGAAGA